MQIINENNEKIIHHEREINKLFVLVKQKNISIIPISLYFKGNFVKLELGIGKGKKLYDKRDDLKKEDQIRYIEKTRG